MALFLFSAFAVPHPEWTSFFGGQENNLSAGKEEKMTSHKNALRHFCGVLLWLRRLQDRIYRMTVFSKLHTFSAVKCGCPATGESFGGYLLPSVYPYGISL
ncbi:MAG: hypothetical protein WCU80_05045 [Paludibacteraceae bacterium]